jgi:transposase
MAEAIGQDETVLLDNIYSKGAPEWFRYLPAIEALRRVWVQNYYEVDQEVRWRTETEGILPPARSIGSPYDQDAHYGRKYTTPWIGYNVHITESCDDHLPHLITNVETTPAITAEREVTPKAHQALQQRALLPAVHIIDIGYLDAELLVGSRENYGVDLLGPTRRDQRCQARSAEGFGLANSTVDFQQRKAVCPEGRESVEWVPRIDNRGNNNISIRFSPSDCAP